jgi:hypothetical protein
VRFEFTRNGGNAESVVRGRRRPEITSPQIRRPRFLIPAYRHFPSVCYYSSTPELLAFDIKWTKRAETRNRPLGGIGDWKLYYQPVARLRLPVIQANSICDR